VGASERRKEIKRRRHRKAKIEKLKTRASNATFSEKAEIAIKIRQLTPGGEDIVSRLELEKR
jgi:hypothetical protein